MAEKDTVGEEFYTSVRRSDTVGECAFYFGIPISIAIFFKDSAWLASVIGERYSVLFDEVLPSMFLVLTLFLFFQSIIHRLYFLPRAEDARRANILTDGFGVPMSEEETVGYYNNELLEPIPRLAANCMESAFFTKKLTRRMLTKSRAFSLVYLLGYGFLLTTRSVELAVVELIAGILFSEYVLARWLRLEFLFRRSETVYEKLRELFAWSSTKRDNLWDARVISAFTLYESTKAISAVSIPEKLFSAMNPSLSAEWDKIRKKIGI